MAKEIIPQESRLDVNDITKFDRTTAELEGYLLLCMVVAGKVAYVQARKLEALLFGAKSLAAYVTNHHAPPGTPRGETPFEWFRAIRQYSTVKEKDLRVLLENVKIGQYGRLYSAIMDLLDANLDLRACTLEQLRAIPGIGPKTARMFLLHSRKDSEHAVLDVHILRFLREQLKMRGVPRNTPPEGPLYEKLEKRFIQFARDLGRSPAELDLSIWTQYSRKERQD